MEQFELQYLLIQKENKWLRLKLSWFDKHNFFEFEQKTPSKSVLS
jgi:hypothetical protein